MQLGGQELADEAALLALGDQRGARHDEPAKERARRRRHEAHAQLAELDVSHLWCGDAGKDTCCELGRKKMPQMNPMFLLTSMMAFAFSLDDEDDEDYKLY